jgi:hypothetical protein
MTSTPKPDPALGGIPDDNQSSQYRYSYVVDQIDGPFKTIQSAIDEGGAQATIKVSPGLYKENIMVTKPGMKIEAKDINSDVYVMGNRGPAVYINIDQGQSCLFQNIKFVHKGGASRQNARGSGMMTFDPNPVVSKMTEGSPGLESYHKNFEKIKFSRKYDSMVYVKSGGVIMRNCMMSLGFVMKCNQVSIPMVLLNTGTSSMISDCKLNGNGSIPTCGIVVKKSTCIIKDTAIEGFISGGIMVWLEGTNICKIFGTKVRDCKTVGIQVMGNSPNPLIECCEIENNKGPGI